FIIGDVAILIQLAGHNSRNIRTGEAGDERDAALARNAQNRAQQRAKQDIRSLERAELFEYTEQAAEEHDRRDQVETGHKTVLCARAARTDQVCAGITDRTERAGEVGKVQ